MDNLNFKRIGEKLRTIRLSKNLTQEYIANAVEYKPQSHQQHQKITV